MRSWKNIATDTLKISYPIIQAPMLGVTTPAMVAEVSNAGGLGSLPVGGLSPELTRQLIQKTKILTNKPFAVNLFAHDLPIYLDEELEPMRQFILKLAHKKKWKVEASDLTNFQFYDYRSQTEILVEEKIPIVSFTFGCLDQQSIHSLKDKSTILIGTATSVKEAMFLQEQKIDMIAIQGIEAGGHRGTFMEDTPLPQIELFELLPQITKSVQIPCIAAGGIHSAKTIKDALDLGAVAVQIGTAFIDTEESEAIPSYKKRLKDGKEDGTALTRAFSGRWARGFMNEMMKEIEQSGIPIPPYPIQAGLTAKLRNLAQQKDDGEYTSLWAGQFSNLGHAKKAREVFINLVKEYEDFFE